MSADKDQYVIINIWTNSRNKALPGKNRIGHISITTPNTHISLWPLRTHSRGTGFFTGDRGLFSPLLSWPSSYKPDYEQDCIMEGAHHSRLVGAKTVLEPGEKVYRFNNETGFWESVASVPKASEDIFYGIKPLKADFRMVLYSLDVNKIEAEFNRLKQRVAGWSLVGSSVLRCLQKETTESCASLVYRCLKSGGFYTPLKSTLSCHTSSSVDPENLLRHVVAAKEKELSDYPETEDWTINGVEEIDLDKVKKAYREQGLHANAEEDFFSVNSFGLSYIK
jgi:hypothetical protein